MTVSTLSECLREAQNAPEYQGRSRVMSVEGTTVRKWSAVSVDVLRNHVIQAVYSAPAGRAALNDLRGWPFPCLEAK